eukprot:COSAG01_NODE_60133_length_296_cov_0.878173_1_plen_34_part_01
MALAEVGQQDFRYSHLQTGERSGRPPAPPPMRTL